MDLLLSSDGNHNSVNRMPAIVWRNVGYRTCDLCTGSKVKLRQLNGHFECNTLNAVMGPSGAGKRRLLNCLSGSCAQSLNETSEIYFFNPDNRSTAISVNFIEFHQQNIPQNLTVGEIFRYAYNFKNGTIYESDIIMEQYINRIAKDLLIEPELFDRKFSECNPGERVRIGIAQHLMGLIKPRLLFLDQPTKGLDPAVAYQVVKCLKNLALNYQLTVISSIVSPCDDLLGLFDKIYVLAKGRL